MKRLMRAPGDVDAVLRDGGERAEALAAPIIAEAKRLVGFLQP
jgi:tryptophanyl-tRNA synthetase